MSVSDVEFAQWLKRDNADRVCLVQLDYQIESTGLPIPTTAYLSDRGYRDGANVYVDCINSSPEYTRAFTNAGQTSGAALGAYQSTYGTLEIDNADGEFDYLLDAALDGSPVRFYYGDANWAFSDFRLIFTALSSVIAATAFDRLSLTITDASLILNQSIGGDFLIGGSGPNADQARPINFGFVLQVACLVIDSTTLLYCHSDSGANTVAQAVRDRGVGVTFTDNGDGTLTLAASPNAQVVADVLALAPDATDMSETTRRRVSDAMLEIAGNRCGLSALDMYQGAAPSFVVADADDYLVGFSIAGQQNALTVLGTLSDSGNCSWAISRLNQFVFLRLRPNDVASLGMSAVDIGYDDIDDDKSAQVTHELPLYYRYQAYMDKNWSTSTDLATSIGPDEHDRLTRAGLYLLQDAAVGVTYADAPELYDLSMVVAPAIETWLSGDGSDVDDTAALAAWMETRRNIGLPIIEMITITVGIQFYALELGDVVNLTMPRFGLDAGALFQVISIDLKLTAAKMILILMRRRLSMPYPDGWVRTTTDADVESKSTLVMQAAVPLPVVPPPIAPPPGVPAGAPWYPGNIGARAATGTGGSMRWGVGKMWPAPGGGGPTTILDDEFTGSGALTAHTSDSGHTWTDTSAAFFFGGGTAGDAAHLVLSGSGALEDNHTTGSPEPAAMSNASIPANCFVEATVVGSNVGASTVFLAWRYQPGGAGYFLSMFGGSGTSVAWFIQSWQGGADPGESTFPSPGYHTTTVANGNNFVIRVEMNGTQIKVYFNGTLDQTITSSHVTAAGSVALSLTSAGSGHSGDGTLDYIHAGSL